MQDRPSRALATAILKLEKAVEARTRSWCNHDQSDLTWDQASAEVKKAETELGGIIVALLTKVAVNAMINFVEHDGDISATTLNKLLTEYPEAPSTVEAA
jgi:hypothetical protein